MEVPELKCFSMFVKAMKEGRAFEVGIKTFIKSSDFMCGDSKYLTLAFCLSAVLLQIYLMKVTL